MKKKILSLALAAALLAIAIVGGTLAYLTDTDAAVNTFTTAHVNIALNEQQRDVVNGQPVADSALEAFENDKVLLPIVGSAQGAKDNMGLVKAANYVDKIITIKNLADSTDAWVRLYIAIPSELDNVDPGKNILHFNVGNNFETGNYTKADYAKWGVETLLAPNYDIDGIMYNIYYRDYNKIMSKDTETGSAAYVGFYLDANVDYDNEEGYYTINDVKINFDLTAGVDIPVFAVGVQAAGFDTCADAVNAAFGEGFNPWGE